MGKMAGLWLKGSAAFGFDCCGLHKFANQSCWNFQCSIFTTIWIRSIISCVKLQDTYFSVCLKAVVSLSVIYMTYDLWKLVAVSDAVHLNMLQNNTNVKVVVVFSLGTSVTHAGRETYFFFYSSIKLGSSFTGHRRK